MIPNKIRESRRVKALKLPKNLERLYKEKKCRECAVVVTRMDFAKILGKFTKVKIQYESSTTPKSKQNSEITSPNSNARLKRNENGMVHLQRNAYNQHPVKELGSKKPKNDSSHITSNILKENNRLKKPILKDKNSNYEDKKKKNNTHLKQYGIVFEDPLANNNNNDVNCKVSLSDLLSQINESILPSDDWCIDFFPKKGEPKDDKVYDRIAAELEDLMFSEKSDKLEEKPEIIETKVDDFPSIMDILNDNSSENKTNDQSNSLEFKSNLESSDVEAMLLGKSNAISEPVSSTPMDVDNPDMGNLIEDVNQFAVIQDNIIVPEARNKLPTVDLPEEIDNPHSPSILDEALQKGIEEHLPCNPDKQAEEPQPVIELQSVVDPQPIEEDIKEEMSTDSNPPDLDTKVEEEINVIQHDMDNKINASKEILGKETTSLASIEGITHLVFKKTKEGACFKTVTCPKNLKYDIEINGKSVEFIGAPRFISSLEDLQVLLQIVNESELDSLYVLY